MSRYFRKRRTISVALAACAVATIVGVISERAQAQPAPGATTPPEAKDNSQEWLIGNAISDPTAPQYRDVAEAITRFRNRDMAGARELLTKARQQFPKLAPVEIMMARMLGAAGQGAAARQELDRAITANGDDPEPYLILAEDALQNRRTTEGEALLLMAQPRIKAFKDNPKRKRDFDIRISSGLAAVAELRTQWDTALDHLKDLIALQSDNVQLNALAHQRMGRALFQKGKSTEAYNELNNAVKLDPNAVNPYIALAQLYEENKDHPNALKSIGYAVKQSPKDLKVLTSAANWGLMFNELNLAQTYAEAATKQDAKSVEAKVLRGRIARMNGDLKTAETLLEQAVMAQPGNLDATNQLALVLVEQDDPDKRNRAAQYADINLRSTTEGNRLNPEALSTAAWVLYKLGRVDEAERALNQVMSSRQVSPDGIYYWARILQDRGKTEDAINILKQVLDNPTPFAQRTAASELLAHLERRQRAPEGKGVEGAPPTKGTAPTKK